MHEFELFLQSVKLDFYMVCRYVFFNRIFLAFLVGIITASCSIALYAARHPHVLSNIIHHETAEAFQSIIPRAHNGTYTTSFFYFKVIYKTIQLLLSVAAISVIALTILVVLFYG